ncbi:MAG: glycosyltransferase family 9 protein [bacterium]
MLNNNKVVWYDKKPFRKIIDNVLFHGLKILTNLDVRKKGSLDINKINKILFIATGGIGDTLFSTFAIRGLREKFPHAQIWLLLNETYFDLFKTDPNINKAIAILPHGYKNFLSSINIIRKGKFDVAVVSHALDYAGTVRPYLAGIKHIIGGMWYRTKFWFLLSNYREHQNYDRCLYNFIECQLHIVKFLDCYPKNLRLGVYLLKDDYIKTEENLEKLGLRLEGTCIGFQIKTQSITKDWPPGKFIELGKKLLKHNPTLKILLLGGPQDKKAGVLIADGIKKNNVFNLVGKTSLRESAVIINRLNVLVTGVTGMLHIAISLGTKTIALLGGPEYYERFGTITPKNKKNIVIIKKPKICNPCNMRVCTNTSKCMDLITVDEVLEGIIRILEKK